MGLSNNFKVLEYFFSSVIDKIVTMHFREGSTVEIGCDFFFPNGGKKRDEALSHYSWDESYCLAMPGWAGVDS